MKGWWGIAFLWVGAPPVSWGRELLFSKAGRKTLAILPGAQQ